MRAFAIFFIVCAHIYPSKGICPIMVKNISLYYYYISHVGVFCFFAISGYLLGYNERSFSDFLKRKIKYIILPWFVTGSLNFIWFYFRKNSFNINVFSDYILYLLGVRNYLWYMSVLMIFYLFFLFFNKNVYVLFASLVLSLLSFVFVGKWYYVVEGWGGQYLNFLNYYPAFLVGYLICLYKNKILLLGGVLVKHYVLCNLTSLILFNIFTVILFYKNIKIEYWSILVLPYAFVAIFMIVSLSLLFQQNQILNTIGVNSFSIYLLHMPVAGIIVNVFNHFDNAILMLIRPFVVLIIVQCFLILFKKITKMTKYEKILNMAIGMR